MSGLTLKNEIGEIESLEYSVAAIISYLDEKYKVALDIIKKDN